MMVDAPGKRTLLRHAYTAVLSYLPPLERAGRATSSRLWPSVAMWLGCGLVPQLRRRTQPTGAASESLNASSEARVLWRVAVRPRQVGAALVRAMERTIPALHTSRFHLVFVRLPWRLL